MKVNLFTALLIRISGCISLFLGLIALCSIDSPKSTLVAVGLALGGILFLCLGIWLLDINLTKKSK